MLGNPRRASMCAVALALVGASLAPAAEDAPPAKSPPAAVRQFRDSVAFQDRGVYDLAADEWGKFLKQFPQDPLAPKAQHYLGLCRLLLKQYDAATVAFQRVIDVYPQCELIDATYLNLGLTQYSIAQAGKPEAYDAAAATFAALAAKFPQSKSLGEALYYRGESLYARGKKEEAAQTYAQLIDKARESPLRADGLYALGVTRQELGKQAEAGANYDQFMKEFPQHALRAEIMTRRGETFFSQKQFAAAEQWFHTAAAAKDFKLADLATLREAASLFEQKKFAEAAARYVTIPDTFPQSTYRASAVLAAGNCYYLLGNLETAEKWLKAALSSGGDVGAEAAHWLARVYLKQNKPAEALQVIEQATPPAKATSYAVPLLLDRADAVYDLDGRRGESIALYAALAKEHPQHAVAPQALYMAAFAALSQSDYQAAQASCERFFETYPKSPLAVDVKAVAAETALQLKAYARAEERYRELLETVPQHADANVWRVRRAVALSLDKKPAEVVAALTPLVAELKTPELVAQAQYLLGSALVELQQYEPAARALEASLAAGPTGKQADEVLLNLAAAQRQLGKSPEAIATLRKLMGEFPQSKLLDRACFRLGEYASAAGDFEAAAAAYRELLKTWPESPLAPHAQYGLAWIELAQKDYATAGKSLDALLTAYPQHPVAGKARYARAMVRQQTKDFAGASEDVAAFLTTNPAVSERLEALYVQGLCASGANDYAKAAEIFRSILTADPKFAGSDKVLYELAWALKSSGKPAEAFEAFSRLAQEHENSPWAGESLYHLGEHLYQAKDYAQAAARYQAAMAKAGKSELGEKSAHKLGWALYQQGQFDRAGQTFEAQVASYPQGELAVDARFMIAESLFGQKNYEAARAAYQQTLEHPPANKEFQALACLHAGQALAQLKQWDQSATLLEKGLKDFPQSVYRPELLYESGWAQQNLNKPDEAMKRYEQVVAESNREVSARAHFMLGEIQLEKQDYKEAVRNFFKVAYGYGYPQSPDSMRTWQANSCYEAARCFEMLKMIDHAKKSYQEVLERYPQSDKAPLAKSRLQALGA